MKLYNQRGLNRHHEQDMLSIIKDTRSFFKKILSLITNTKFVIIIILFFIILINFFPFLSEILIFILIFIITYYVFYREEFPVEKPKKYFFGDCYFLGNEKHTNKEIWVSNDDMKTHILMFGSTGSGKTESLISIAYNALLQSSGFIYVDGKGDNILFSKIFSMVRYMSREDDLLLINFMTGAKDITKKKDYNLSNTMNPFSYGSSSMLSQLIISLMESNSSSNDSDMWKGRAIVFVESLMKILVVMRDHGLILLDANSIRYYFDLHKIEYIVFDKKFIINEKEAIDISKFKDSIFEPMKNYLNTLPGFHISNKNKQSSQTYEQHGFITMQLTRIFGSLADTYGHIMRHKLAEVDMKDVVLNRRILIVLLPALEKSSDELSNLGKIIVATLKMMMVSCLGEKVDGEYYNLIENKESNANNPYLCILDEYGYYAVKGFSIIPAQARSLGFSMIFAGQDLPALQKVSKEEAATIGANSNIKISMKLEDPKETWDFFMKTAGESYVAHISGFSNDKGLYNTYTKNNTARLEKRTRIDFLDLKEQTKGEGHIFFKSNIIRYNNFYINSPPVKKIRINQFLDLDFKKEKIIDIINPDIDINNNYIFSNIYKKNKTEYEKFVNINNILDNNIKNNTSYIESSIFIIKNNYFNIKNIFSKKKIKLLPHYDNNFIINKILYFEKIINIWTKKRYIFDNKIFIKNTISHKMYNKEITLNDIHNIIKKIIL